MTMHTQPVAARALPCVGPFVGAAPEDRHAERIVREMLAFLGDLTKQTRPQLDNAMLRKIGGSPKAQARFLERVQNSRSPAIVDIASTFGRRCRFSLLVSLWEADEHGGSTVWTFTSVGRGPGRVERGGDPSWRISRHALIRLVQRVEAHDALRLLYAMRELAGPVLAAIADSSLAAGDGQTLKAPFPGGVAVLGWPEDSTIAVVKTVLPEAASYAEKKQQNGWRKQ